MLHTVLVYLYLHSEIRPGSFLVFFNAVDKQKERPPFGCGLAGGQYPMTRVGSAVVYDCHNVASFFCSVPKALVGMKVLGTIMAYLVCDTCKLQICKSIYTWLHFHMHNHAVRKGNQSAQGSYSTWFPKLTGLHNNQICTTCTVQRKWCLEFSAGQRQKK